jgi:asparagine synthase (glutamine-hydrolysing)
LIRSNSFALLSGKDVSEELVKVSRRVGRYHSKILVSTGGDFKELGDRMERSDKTIVVFSIGREGKEFPVVHGFTDGHADKNIMHNSGEFVLLTKMDGNYISERDLLGTRPLFVSEGTMKCIASDHRFCDSRIRLLPPGVVYSISRGIMNKRRLVRERKRRTFQEAEVRLARLIERSVMKRVDGHKKVAISFSGGLDSSLVALVTSRYTSVLLCSVFTKGSRDERYAKIAADRLNLEFVSSIIEKEQVANELRSIDLPFEPSPMDKTLWCLYSSASRMASERGATLLLLGQLADELFGGYMKYALEVKRRGEEATRRMMNKDVYECSRHGFIRDEMASSRWIEPRFPFADEDIVRFALGLPISYNIFNGVRKRILRSVALMMGLPEELASSPKKAAQYSSGLIKFVQ